LKKLSGTNPRSKPPEPTFFTDRDLGKTVPRLLREGGLLVERYADHFAERNVADEEWLTFAGKSRWVAISHDRNIRSDPVAVGSVMESGLRLFIIRGKNLTGPEKADLFLGALREVYRALNEEPSSFIATVRRISSQGGLVRPDVKVHLTFREWLRGKIGDFEGDLDLP
jgi:hypothetical protein